MKMAKSGAERQSEYRDRLKKKNEKKEVTVFIPNSLSGQLSGDPGKLVTFFEQAEELLGSVETKAYERELKALKKNEALKKKPTREELIENRRALGVSVITNPAKARAKAKKMGSDIEQLKNRRDELKGDLRPRIEKMKSLDRAIGNTRFEADGWLKLLDEIHAALAGRGSPVEVSMMARIEALKGKLRETCERNRERSARFTKAQPYGVR